MVPEIQAASRANALVDLAPDRPLDVPLHWQQWKLDSPPLSRLPGRERSGRRHSAPRAVVADRALVVRERQPDLRRAPDARAGGWRDLATMKRSYQQPDPATTLRAIENPPSPRNESEDESSTG